MEASLTIRTFRPDEWPTYREVRLRSLADSPDAYGSTLASEEARSPDDWKARLAAAAESGKDYPLVAELAGKAAGLLWAKVDSSDPAVVNIFQVWVAPESRGHGVAASLVREAINWAKSKNARVVQLGVTTGDTAARRLYIREGFRDFGTPEQRKGSTLFEKAMRFMIDQSGM